MIFIPTRPLTRNICSNVALRDASCSNENDNKGIWMGSLLLYELYIGLHFLMDRNPIYFFPLYHLLTSLYISLSRGSKISLVFFSPSFIIIRREEFVEEEKEIYRVI